MAKFIINKIIEIYQIEDPIYSDESSVMDYIFMGLGGVVLVAVLGYSVYSSLNKKK